MSGECALLRSEVAVALCRLLIEPGRGLAKTCLLHAQLTKALTGRDLLLREVAVEAGCGLTELCLLLRLLTDRLTDVGDLASSGLFGRRALRFERSQLATGLYAESRLLRGKLCRGLTEPCLLRCGRNLPLSRLLKHARSSLTEPRLLCGDLCRLTTELARSLRTLQRTLLLLLKRSHRLGLRLRVALREKIRDRARLLLHQAALHLGTLHALALATERAGSYGLRRKTLLRDLALAIDLPHRLVDDLLTIRIHEGLRTRRVIALRTATDRTDALLNGLLCGLESRLLSSGSRLLRTTVQSADALRHARSRSRRARHLDGFLPRSEALLDRLLRTAHLRHGCRTTLRGLLQKLLRAGEVCACCTSGHALRIRDTPHALADRGRGRGQVRLRSTRRHVLRSGKRIDAGADVLIRRAEATGRIRRQRTLAGEIHVAKARINLVDATAHARSGSTRLTHGHLSIGELATSVCTAKHVRCFTSRRHATSECLVSRRDVRRECAYALLFGGLHRRELRRREARNLISRKLLRKTRLRGQISCLLQQVKFISLDLRGLPDNLLLN